MGSVIDDMETELLFRWIIFLACYSNCGVLHDLELWSGDVILYNIQFFSIDWTITISFINHECHYEK